MTKKIHEPYQRLKGKMREKGLNYEDISKLLSISTTAVSHKINGKSDFLLSQALAVEARVGLDVKKFTQ